MANSPHLDFAGEIRAATQFPTFHAAKIPDVATARHAIATGKVDMVGMTRAHMTDPFIVRKIAAGRENDIRPLCGRQLLSRSHLSGRRGVLHPQCRHRPRAVHSHEIPPAQLKRRIVVVGAGPAGLEAARVAAERGHEVVVFEATGQPGGQVRLTAQSQRRREMISIIDWRMAQCSAAGVQFHFDVLAGPSDVIAARPDVVIIATGGYPDTAVLKSGSELAVSSWDNHLRPRSARQQCAAVRRCRRSRGFAGR